MIAIEILNIIDDLCNAFGQYSDLAEKTNSATEPEKRINAMQEQSVNGREIYLTAADAMKALNNALLDGFDKETADAVFEKTLDCYLNDSLDYIILETLSKKLLEYYEKTDEVAKIISVLSVLGYSCLELSYLDSKKYLKPTIDAFSRIIEYRNDSCLLLDEKLALRLITAFYNICTVCAIRDQSFVPFGWETYQSFMEWLESDFGKKIVEMYPDTIEIIDSIKDSFVGGIYFVDPTYNSKEAESSIKEKMKKGMEKEGKLTAEICFDYISYLRIMVRHQPEKVRDYYNDMIHYYEETMDSIKDPDIISGYHTICLEMIHELFSAASFSSKELEKESTYIKKRMLDYFRLEQATNDDPAVLTEAIPNLLFSQRFIELFSSSQEKIDVIQKMFISRHISTYMHCNMVSVFSECIAKWALKKKPELFVGLEEIKSPEEAIEKSDVLISVIHRHAMLHDIGKIGIQEVVSRQYRPITDEEFMLIKSHPVAGAEYLEGISGLEECADTARGHHKFYNGQGGYPIDFDNTKSPVRLIIDIVTLSDCLDAATDYMGRNYRNVKTAAQVVDEFKAGAGVRYNPYLVELMSDQDMVAELDSIASTKRRQIFIESCHTSAMALK